MIKIIDGIIISLTITMATFFGYHWRNYLASPIPIELEQHEDCHDTKTQEAWFAKRNGELRCFLEKKEYPHRVQGYNLDVDTN